ncbi:hypothetical protein LCGC14_0262280 [marine sediment metagenome]|uniref:Uncharacterized protein n=1 Tax=marine sediment metagenome TaxID=412755 RepID=A0A0F9U5S7_9ZZZZ
MASELVFGINSALIIILALMLMRGHVVSRLRSRLLDEELAWIELRCGEVMDAGYHFFERYRRLPSYTAMMLKFWKTMGSFEREAGAIEQYYPLLK